jgi:hypothetical protein
MGSSLRIVQVTAVALGSEIFVTPARARILLKAPLNL